MSSLFVFTVDSLDADETSARVCKVQGKQDPGSQRRLGDGFGFCGSSRLLWGGFEVSLTVKNRVDGFNQDGSRVAF
jgi:hypothetical protein